MNIIIKNQYRMHLNIQSSDNNSLSFKSSFKSIKKDKNNNKNKNKKNINIKNKKNIQNSYSNTINMNDNKMSNYINIFKYK